MFVIKWCLYYNGDYILRPHFTWKFNMVDCTEYITKESIKSDYSYTKDFIK